MKKIIAGVAIGAILLISLVAVLSRGPDKTAFPEEMVPSKAVVGESAKTKRIKDAILKDVNYAEKQKEAAHAEAARVAKLQEWAAKEQKRPSKYMARPETP